MYETDMKSFSRELQVYVNALILSADSFYRNN